MGDRKRIEYRIWAHTHKKGIDDSCFSYETLGEAHRGREELLAKKKYKEVELPLVVYEEDGIFYEAPPHDWDKREVDTFLTAKAGRKIPEGAGNLRIRKSFPGMMKYAINKAKLLLVGRGKKENKEYEKDLQELKQRLLRSSNRNLEKIKSNHKKVEDREEEIECMVSCRYKATIFEKDLKDKEFDIFADTYYFMLYYAPAIDEVLEELRGKLKL